MSLGELFTILLELVALLPAGYQAPIASVLTAIEKFIAPSKNQQRDINASTVYGLALAGSGTAAGRVYGDTLPGNPNGEPPETVKDMVAYWADLEKVGWKGIFTDGAATVVSPAGASFAVVFTPPSASSSPPAPPITE